MQRLLGPRTVAEAVFLVAVPVIAVVAGSGTWTIVGASAVAYLLVLVVETVLYREAGAAAAPPAQPGVPVVPMVAPPLVPPVPAPVVETAGPADPVEPMPEAEPEPEPPPRVERPALTALPTLPPPPPAPPEPEPEPTNVVPLGVGSAPRQWSVWELERLSREHAGDPLDAEERRFLLMYLRDFADADGQLPVDFDALVRESFGDLLAR